MYVYCSPSWVTSLCPSGWLRFPYWYETLGFRRFPAQWPLATLMGASELWLEGVIFRDLHPTRSMEG